MASEGGNGARGVTEEEVWATAEAMVAEGRRPTLRAVRKELGLTGSYSTIQPHLKRWRDRQTLAPGTPSRLPDDLAGTIGEAIERHVATARSQLKEQLDESEGALDVMTEENEQQARLIEGLQQRIEVLEVELATCQGRTAKAEEDATAAIESAKIEREAAERARIEAARAELQAESLQDAVSGLRDENGKLSESVESLRSQVAASDKACAVAEKAEEALGREVESVNARLARTEAELQRAREREDEAWRAASTQSLGRQSRQEKASK